MAFPDGALRITRTAGRTNAKNCINLSDIIHAAHLKSACIYSFFIAESEFYPHLPFSQTSNDVPIFIGRDANMDPMVMRASQEAGIPFKEKVTRKDLDIIRGNLQRLHGDASGRKNLHTFYAWCSGSAHTKALLLVYPDFLRIVITSCNMMDIDTELGDNHWYLHDVPKLRRPTKSSSTQFEANLLSHMEALGAPEVFLSSVRGQYDYSSVKVHLITSVPGTHSGAKAEQHGLLRLRRVMRKLNTDLGKQYSSTDLGLEVCTASIGNLTPKWLHSFYDCLRGSEDLGPNSDTSAVPNMKIFFPTTQDVESASIQARQGASNIGCHMRPWKDAPVSIKNLFRRYQSKDKGCLFHQKFILAYNPRDPDQSPYFVYVGSANLSQSAWGALEHDRRGNKATSDMKLVKMSNFECGVLIQGDTISALLEYGTKTWQDGIVPHVQTTAPYNLSEDKAWNSPEWVAGYGESQNR
ncbi:phospholipase D/nuclease [Xylariaceae sp. FL1019]|nr:phospholipase D/nuclease [Xylariaceae sp. FL1019]